MDGVVIEAGVAVGYLIAWAARKARRAGGRLDAEADAVIDASLDRLHEVVETKLVGHPVLAELADEAAGAGQVSEPTRQQVELALLAAAGTDEAFGQAVTHLLARLREAEQAATGLVDAGAGSVVFTGDARAEARDRGIAFGQVAGDVHVEQAPGGPPGPGRSGR